jgi:hypothetical protein
MSKIKLIKKKHYKHSGEEKLHGEEIYRLCCLLYCLDYEISDFRMGMYGVRRRNTEKLYIDLTGKALGKLTFGRIRFTLRQIYTWRNKIRRHCIESWMDPADDLDALTKRLKCSRESNSCCRIWEDLMLHWIIFSCSLICVTCCIFKNIHCNIIIFYLSLIIAVRYMLLKYILSVTWNVLRTLIWMT